MTRKNPDPANMTFGDHLEVVRWSLIRIAAALAVFFVLSFTAMPYIFDSFILGATSSDFFLYRWFSKLSGALPFIPDFSDDRFSVDIININVASQFMTHMSVSFWMAVILLFPYIVFELWLFVKPALYPHEKKGIATAFCFGTFMFYIGCAVGYCIVFPFTFRFLVEYTLGTHIVNQISLNSYMSNFFGMVFIMGLVFEMPPLAWVLSKLGVLHRAILKKYRRHAIVLLMIAAAVITPSGDPFTMMLVFIPLYLLYEIAVCIVKEKPVESDTQ